MISAVHSKKRVFACAVMLCANAGAVPPVWQHIADAFWAYVHWTVASPITSGVPATPEQIEKVTRAQLDLGVVPDKCLPVMRMAGAQSLKSPLAARTTECEISLQPKIWTIMPHGYREHLALHESVHHLRGDSETSKELVANGFIAEVLLDSIAQAPMHLFDTNPLIGVCAHTLMEVGVREYVGPQILSHSWIRPFWADDYALRKLVNSESCADGIALHELCFKCKQCLIEAAACQFKSADQPACEKSLGYLSREKFLACAKWAEKRLCPFHQSHVFMPMSAGFTAVVGADIRISALIGTVFDTASYYVYYPLYALSWWLGNYAGLTQVPVISDIGLKFFVSGLHQAFEKIALKTCGCALEPIVHWAVVNFLWCNQCLNEAADALEKQPELQKEIGYSAQELRERAKQVHTVCHYHADKVVDGSALSVSQTFWMRALAKELKGTDACHDIVHAFERYEKPEIMRLHAVISSAIVRVKDVLNQLQVLENELVDQGKTGNLHVLINMKIVLMTYRDWLTARQVPTESMVAICLDNCADIERWVKFCMHN